MAHISSENPVAVSFVLLLGYGSIGQGLTPLLMQHFGLKPPQIRIIAADEEGDETAMMQGLHVEKLPLTPDNYEDVLNALLQPGSWLINVSVDVASAALMAWCQRHGVYYLDTCIEPWAGGYRCEHDIAATTNYMLREEALRLSREDAPTALVAHGANPGLVSHFVKAGLEELAALRGVRAWSSWADLASLLGVRVIQIAERDTQSTHHRLRSSEFVNTWSAHGLMAEAWQRAELGWGTHEAAMPEGATTHRIGDRSGIFLAEHSANVHVKSWVPAFGPQTAYLISHHEALSIAHLLTLPGPEDVPLYRPTVYFAYHPAPIACESLHQWEDEGYGKPQSVRVMREEIREGFDQLGVLFVFDGGAYWYGSTLDIRQARALAPFNSATSLQVVAGILGGMERMRRHPRAGVVEAEHLEHTEVLKVALPYLGKVEGTMTDWQPAHRGGLQFADFRLPTKQPLPQLLSA